MTAPSSTPKIMTAPSPSFYFFSHNRASRIKRTRRFLGTLLLDLIQGSPHDRPLELGRPSATTLLHLLHLDLLVQSAPTLRPNEAGGLLALVVQALGLGGREDEGSTVTAHEADAVPGVHLQRGEEKR